MNQYKLPPLSEMERIEQSIISEKLDEILERIDQEDIGFIITENGKDKYVLVPYRWYEDNFSDEVGCIVNSAIRQEITAESENAEAVRRFIWNHYTALDDRTLSVATKDIEYHINTPIHLVPKSDEWLKLQAAFQTELERRGTREKGIRHE